MRTPKLVHIAALAFVALVSSGWVIKETKQDEDFVLSVNDGGTQKAALKLTGATGGVTLGAANDTVSHTVNVGAAARAIKFGPGDGNVRPGLVVDNAGASVAASLATGAGNPQFNFAGGTLLFQTGLYSDVSDPLDLGTAGGTTIGQATTGGAWSFGASGSSATHTMNGSLDMPLVNGATVPASGVTTAGLKFGNQNSGSVSTFISATSTGNNTPLTIIGRVNTDSSANDAAVVVTGQTVNNGTLSTKAIFQVRNLNTVLLSVHPTGGSSILGATDGTFASAGFVGEYVTNTVAAGPTVSADTAVNGTGSITLSGGRWLICYDLAWGISKTSAVNSGVACEVTLETTANSEVANMKSHLQSSHGTTAWGIVNNTTRCTEISITSSTTYRIQLRGSHANTDATCTVFNGDITGVLSGNDGHSNLWAMRLP